MAKKITPWILADLIAAQDVYVNDTAHYGDEPEDMSKITVDGRVDFISLADAINRHFEE